MNHCKTFMHVFIVLICFKTYSQTINSESDPVEFKAGQISGDLSSFVSHDFFTGITSTNIPFYKYENNGANLSLSMNYTLHGIRVDDLPSNIGSGWKLKTGASISRLVRGGPDEINVSGCPGFGVVDNNSPVNGYWYSGNNDTEPDYFTVSISNNTFSFMFSQYALIFTVPENAPYKIERYLDGSAITGNLSSSATSGTGNLKFIITDKEGNKYFFSPTLLVNYFYNFPASTFFAACNISYSVGLEWGLEKVVTYEGEIINYYYDVVNINTLLTNNQQVRECHNNFAQEINKYDPVGITSSRLTKIEYPNNIDVSFLYDNSHDRVDLPGDLRLQKLTVAERSTPWGAAPTSYSYTFDHSYFYSPSSTTVINASSYTSGTLSSDLSISSAIATGGPSSRYRLKLNSIRYTGVGSASMNYCKFEYDPVPLPERYYGARDMFGYANSAVPQYYTNLWGVAYNLYIPNHSFDATTGYSSIGVSNCPDQMSTSSSLTKITNRFGGEVAFGSSPLINQFGAGDKVGGIIVGNISYYDGYSHENDINKYYTYANPEHFCNEDNFTYNSRQGFWSRVSGTSYFVFDDFIMYSIVGNALNYDLNGPSYGFRTVTEMNKNNLGALISKKIRKFTGIRNEDADGNYIDDNKYIPNFTNSDADFNRAFGTPPFTNKQYLRRWGIGLLLEEQINDANDNIIHVDKYYYDVYTSYTQSAFDGKHKLAKTFDRVSTTGFGSLMAVCVDTYNDLYFPFSGHTSLRKLVKRDYYSNVAYFDKTYNYTYGSGILYRSFGGLLKSIEYLNSKGETMRENFYYNFEWPSTTSAAINQMNGDNLAKMLFADKWKISGGTGYLVELVSPGLSLLSGNMIRKQFSYALATSSGSPITTSGFAADLANMSRGVNVSGFKMKSSTTKFDDKGNSIESSDLAGNGGNTYMSKIIDENGNILAAAPGAHYDEIAYCGFESDYSYSNFIKGNIDWTIGGTTASRGITTTHHFLGRASYQLDNTHGIWTTGNLVNGKKYALSIWILHGGAVNASSGTGAATVAWNLVTSYTVPVTGEVWDLYKGTFVKSGSGGGIGIWSASSTAYVDDIKIYPIESMMETACFLPLIGKVANVDMNDRVTTYEYDSYGNLKLTRDQNGNIITKNITVTQGR